MFLVRAPPRSTNGAAGAPGPARTSTPAELNALVRAGDRDRGSRAAAEELTGRWPEPERRRHPQTPYLLIGTVELMIEDLEVRRQRWGISYTPSTNPTSTISLRWSRGSSANRMQR
jgi:hypothetical protein